MPRSIRPPCTLTARYPFGLLVPRIFRPRLQLHLILKSNTSDSQKSWFAVGDYKRLANEVGDQETIQPADVHRYMKALLADYNALKKAELDDIIDFHVRFERIHPFQDGNGRSGAATAALFVLFAGKTAEKSGDLFEFIVKLLHNSKNNTNFAAK